jgi:hypothetical protein
MPLRSQAATLRGNRVAVVCSRRLFVIRRLFAYGRWKSSRIKTFYLEAKYFVFVTVVVEKVWQICSKIM